jgi:hypothetical protein
VNDISVSRRHASIKSRRGNLYLEDNSSKFGTLLHVNRPIKLEPGDSLILQYGRSIFAYRYLKPTGCWPFGR